MTDATPTPPAEPPPPSKPIWTRWWMIVLYVIVGIGIFANLFPAEDDGDTTAAPATTLEGAPTTDAEEPTTTTDTTTPTLDNTAREILSVLGDEVRSWGVSESSWTCIETGLIEGGYLEGLDDLGFLDLFLLDEDAPLTEMPPEFEHLSEGIAIYLYDLHEGCLSPAELTVAREFFAANPEGPMTYGSEPTLDMLYDGCQAGSLADCDMLFLISEFGSEYEDQAITCGGRIEPIADHTNCMFTEQDFTEIDDLIAQCESGFYLTCDALSIVSLIGSPEKDIGTSCGGIREPNDTVPCFFAYGFGSR